MHPENQRPGPDGIDANWDQVTPRLREAISNAFHEGKFPILLFGPQGRGKTFTMASVYRKVTPPAAWFAANRFVRLIQECRRAENGRTYALHPTYGHVEEQLFAMATEHTPLLLIDDIGLIRPSESAFGIIYELVDRRRNRPAVFTSNLFPEEIHDVYDARIASRLSAGTVIHVTGKDRRIKNNTFLEVSNDHGR